MPIIEAGGIPVHLPDELGAGCTGGGFAFGLYKAGSTMLNSALRKLTANTKTAFFDFPDVFRRAGTDLELVDLDDPTLDLIIDYVARPGIVWSGWRDYPCNYQLALKPDTRAYLLVRDPRDMVTSHYFSLKYSHRATGVGAGNILRKREQLQILDIDSFVLDDAPKVVEWFRGYEILTESQTTVRRYEDIIFDKPKFLSELRDLFEIDIPDERLMAVAEEIDQRPEVEDETAHVRHVTPGDHREKLKPETIERLNHFFRKILSVHDYPV